MADHLQVNELHEGRGLDVYGRCKRLSGNHLGIGYWELTHVLAADFGATFFQAVLDVLALVALVIPQTSDEVVEGLFEPVGSVSVPVGGGPGRERDVLHLVGGRGHVWRRWREAGSSGGRSSLGPETNLGF